MLIFNKVIKNILFQKLFWISLSLGTLSLIFWGSEKIIAKNNKKTKCDRTQYLILTNNESRSLQGEINNRKSLCYQFYVRAGQQLIIDSDVQVRLQSPDTNISLLQGKKNVNQIGEYLLNIEKVKDYRIKLEIQEPNRLLTKTDDNTPVAKTNIERRSTSNSEKKVSTQLIYSPIEAPNFQQDRELQNIVDDIVAVASQRGLKTDKLSISIVNLKSNNSESYAYASFQDNQPRYPASVVKLFWLVVLFGQYEKKILPLGKISEKVLSDLIRDSDNEAGSLVLDTITKSESGSSLPLETIKAWKAKRDTVNLFFEKAGYTNINISQKTYPIPYLKMNLPVGRDKQLRDKNLELRKQENNPIRNYLTTESVARLFWEIYSNQSISDFYSNEMKKLLIRDLNPAAWKNKPYNAIKGFLGEGLPPDTNFYSKMGWTFNNRNDAAIIISPDRQVRYILVVFGDDKSFYQDKSFLPEASRLVYQQMTKRKENK